MLALIKDLNLKLITKSDFLHDWDDLHDVHPLVPLGIRCLKHKCAGSSEDLPFATVSDVSALSTAFSTYPHMSGQGERLRKVVKRFRFDARDPAVSQLQQSNQLLKQRDTHALLLTLITYTAPSPPFLVES